MGGGAERRLLQRQAKAPSLAALMPRAFRRAMFIYYYMVPVEACQDPDGPGYVSRPIVPRDIRPHPPLPTRGWDEGDAIRIPETPCNSLCASGGFLPRRLGN